MLPAGEINATESFLFQNVENQILTLEIKKLFLHFFIKKGGYFYKQESVLILITKLKNSVPGMGKRGKGKNLSNNYFAFIFFCFLHELEKFYLTDFGSTGPVPHTLG